MAHIEKGAAVIGIVYLVGGVATLIFSWFLARYVIRQGLDRMGKAILVLIGLMAIRGVLLILAGLTGGTL